MKKESLWLATSHLPTFPKLEGDLEVDVVVVGGGITGLTTAYLLKKSGCSVAVVDQKDVGCGETAHTTAHVTFVTDSRLHELVDSVGKPQAHALWDAGLGGMRQIEEIATELQVECELRHVPGFLFAALDKDADEETKSLERDAGLAEEMGFDANFLKSDPIFNRPAICFPNQLKFHPLKYVKALAEAVPGNGCHVFGNTRGSDIDKESHELRTDQGVIRYKVLVAATHVPVQGERGTLGAALFQTKLAGYSTYAIEAGIPCTPEALFWDTNDPYRYMRFDQGQNGCSVIIGGEDHKTGQEKDTEACYDRLEKALMRSFPAARPAHRWSGQVLETPDGLPYIGEVSENQLLATGFSGNGMTLGTFSAMLIRDIITGMPNAHSDLFSPHRIALKGTWEYLRENKDFPAYLVKSHLKPAASLDELHRCSGAVIDVDGKKRAVYCDQHGKRTILSPVCPHMGCVVAWNEAEKSWDCPCHGSRFAATGKLITGPAEADLTPANS